MILKNKTQDIVITPNAYLATSFFDRLLGLLNPKLPRSIVFQTHFGLHTMFLKQSIDVLLLDNQYQIIKLKENLKPFSFFFYHPRYSIVIELPQGTIKKYHLRLNDKISLYDS